MIIEQWLQGALSNFYESRIIVRMDVHTEKADSTIGNWKNNIVRGEEYKEGYPYTDIFPE